MSTITLSSKGQLTIPRQLCVALGHAAAAKLQATITAHGRLVLVPSPPNRKTCLAIGRHGAG